MFLSFAVSTEQMGNKIYKMLKMNFENEPKILTRNYKTGNKKFVEGIYSFVVSIFVIFDDFISYIKA